MLACQSENNIAVVGKEQTKLGRHSTDRVDAYIRRRDIRAFFRPYPACSARYAPCEVVCPVGATNHTTEGLNDMVYNRCVGTRYARTTVLIKCGASTSAVPGLGDAEYKMMRNPDVSVRSRGVHGKVHLCVQRISERRIDAEREDRKINDNETGDGLQQSVVRQAPSSSATSNDPNSKVSSLKSASGNYSLLGELTPRRGPRISRSSQPEP